MVFTPLAALAGGSPADEVSGGLLALLAGVMPTCGSIRRADGRTAA